MFCHKDGISTKGNALSNLQIPQENRRKPVLNIEEEWKKVKRSQTEGKEKKKNKQKILSLKGLRQLLVN